MALSGYISITYAMINNKAFRLEGVTREKFTGVEGETKLPEIPTSDRIFLDEEAAQELRDSEIGLRSVGFCKLKGFSGLHQVFEVIWDNNAQLSRSEQDSHVALQSSRDLKIGVK